MSESQQWRPTTFEGFKVDKVLSHDSTRKEVAILGSFEGKAGQAVVRLNRQHFSVDELAGALGTETKLTLAFENDIYSKYTASLPVEHALVNVDLIHPATERHVDRALEQPQHMVRETPEVYQQRVLPLITAVPPARLQWVYNILDKKAEVERLIFEDPDPGMGFMMHPDMKWDQVVNDQLYCLVLSHRRDIACLRNLTAEHLPLLRNIRDKACQAVEQRFQVPASDLRLFVHYPPSYYHFHVHVTHVKWYGLGVAVGKAHLLNDIIDNIETFGSDFYQRRTLSLIVGENEELWQQAFQPPGGPSSAEKKQRTA